VNAQAEVFGLHENARMSRLKSQSRQLLRTWLNIQPRDSGAAAGAGAGGKPRTSEDVVCEIAGMLLERFPEEILFDIVSIRSQYPTDYNESMNSVLCQELERFNGLLEVMRSSLNRIQRAAAGEEVVDDELEQMFSDIYNGVVPAAWKQKSYPSLKPLSGYTDDLKERLSFFAEWVQSGKPAVYWMSGFYFTHSLLTGALQNYCRAHQYAIDQVGYEFEALGEDDQRCNVAADSGIYVRGLFLEGARWDYQSMHLVESEPRVLFTAAPRLWLRPTLQADREVLPAAHASASASYRCPLYNTSERRGTLSTTGHSTNFVMNIDLDCSSQAAHWIRRGTCALLQLDD